MANPLKLYATDTPNIAIFYATRPLVMDARHPFDWYFSAETAESGTTVRASHNFIANRGPGFVYVVKPDNFILISSPPAAEYYTTRSIKPLMRLPVLPEDFPGVITPMSEYECMVDYARFKLRLG